MERTAGEIMDRAFPYVGRGVLLTSAADRLDVWGLSVVPVVEADATGRFLLGTLSEGDILAAYIRGKHYLQPDLKVADVMRPHPMSVNYDTRLSAIANILVDLDLRFLPVVQAGRLQGIIRRRDVLKAMNREYHHWAARPASERRLPEIADLFTPVYLLHESRERLQDEKMSAIRVPTIS